MTPQKPKWPARVFRLALTTILGAAATLAAAEATGPGAAAADRPAKEKAAGKTKAKTPARIRYADTLIPASRPTQVVTYKTVNGRDLKLHVFRPAGWTAADRRPAFVTIHGGGWSGGDATWMFPVAAHAAQRGLVAFSVEYRLVRPGSGTTVFDCVADGRAAVRAVRARAAEFGIDPAKVIANGASAGGHVAAGAALFRGIDAPGEDLRIAAEPDALVLFYPVIDTSAEGYGQAKIGERWRELSPVHRVRAGLPPTLTFHGTGDTVTPFAGAQRFHEAMQQAGNRSELEVQPGGAHGYILYERVHYEDALAKMDAFLGRLGLLPAP